MPDLLSDILMRLSLRGTIYFRTEFTPPWGVAVPAYAQVARFHYVHRGDCILDLEGGPTVDLAQGDLVIIPHGAAHALRSRHSPADDVLPLDRMLAETGYDGSGVLVFGEEGGGPRPETRLICGHVSFEGPMLHPILDRLPDHILLPGYGERAGPWLDATLRMIAGEAGQGVAGGDLIALKLSETIFVQALRWFLETEGAAAAGLRGFSDPRLAAALSAFHADPAGGWSVAGLARAAGLSRTAFSTRFAALIGMTPLAYVTRWRMLLASRRLASGREPLVEIAQSVGYGSEAAFSRVFRREIGMPPAAYRRAVRA